jgi:hypothetical protein
VLESRLKNWLFLYAKNKEDLFMTKMKNQETNKSLAYTESKSLREETLGKVDYDILDKIKVIPYLTNEMVVTTFQIAEYYECSMDAVKKIIQRNRDEFESDGIVVLKGKELQDFKEKVCQGQDVPNLKNVPSLTILTKRSLLRIGMILTNSKIAKEIRDYLLNIESVTEFDRKSWAIQREVGIIERKRMTSAISKYIPNSKHKQFAYPNYTNMIYKVIFGKVAKELREERHVNTNDALRDTFTEDELHSVEEVETIVTGLITMSFTYKQIEDMLKARYTKRIA